MDLPDAKATDDAEAPAASAAAAAAVAAVACAAILSSADGLPKATACPGQQGLASPCERPRECQSWNNVHVAWMCQLARSLQRSVATAANQALRRLVPELLVSHCSKGHSQSANDSSASCPLPLLVFAAYSSTSGSGGKNAASTDEVWIGISTGTGTTDASTRCNSKVDTGSDDSTGEGGGSAARAGAGMGACQSYTCNEFDDDKFACSKQRLGLRIYGFFKSLVIKSTVEATLNPKP